jgi:hypothetical protein
LNKKNLTELKSFPKPPKEVERVLASVMDTPRRVWKNEKEGEREGEGMMTSMDTPRRVWKNEKEGEREGEGMMTSMDPLRRVW